MLMTGKVRPTRRFASSRPAIRPTLDTLEPRQLLAVSPIIQGTVFNDLNANGALDTTEAPLAGATINLYAANSTTPLATTTSGLDGGYAFNNANVPGGLTVGATYTLTESLAGYKNTGAQALSQVDPAKVMAPNAIQVTVVDPAAVTASWAGFATTPFDAIYYSVNGSAGGTVPTQLSFNLTGDANLTSTSLTSLCVGLHDDLAYNTPFATVLDPQSALAANGGRIAYLYNHYALGLTPGGTTLPASIQNLSAKNVSAGLQLAIWQLEYGPGLTLNGYDADYTSAQDYADLQAAASAFVADSLGKSEKVLILDASLTGSLPTPTATSGGQSILASMSYNFGDQAIPPGTVTGTIYNDLNNSGAWDGGTVDAPIGGISVSLVNPTTGVSVASTTSNPDGSYTFTNVAPGTYNIVEGAVPGYLPSSTNTGSLVGITVTSNQVSKNNNFGEIRPGSIAGVVYQDKTGDGLTSDDSALSGVTVQLLGANGTVLATRKVGADGSYLFDNLAPGAYTVREVTPSGYVQTAPNTPAYYVVPLVANQNVTARNFDNYQVTCGCCPIGKISYTVVGPCGVSTYSSLGGNTDQGDQVTVNFTVGGNSPVTVTFVTYTATSNFDLTKQAIFGVDTETLAPGPHSLTVTIPNSYYQIDFVCGGAIAQFNPSANITYHGEGRFIDADNGGSEAVPTSFASLSGQVFVDANYDGNFGPGDSGLGGVTVRLTGKDVNGQVVSLTRLTNKDGSYSFNGLQPGTYAVREVTPGGYFTTKDTVGKVNGTAVGALTGPDTIGGITLGGGSTAVSYNFGEQATGAALGCNQTASTCFWASCSGQNLIRSLNGGANSTSLGNWLASTCPNSLSCLAGKTNAQVAAFFQSSYNSCRCSPVTEGLATALAIYATDASLAGGNFAGCYGLKVTAAGAGAATINLGSTFACYGGPQGCTTLMQFLQYADNFASCSDAWFWYRIACVFDAINGAGSC